MSDNKEITQPELFLQIWNETRIKQCFVTGRRLSFPVGSSLWFSCFAHILSKKNFPEYKLRKDNIILLHPEVHHLYDNGDIKRIKSYEVMYGCDFLPLFHIEKIMLEKYIQETGKKRKLRNLTQRYLEYENRC